MTCCRFREHVMYEDVESLLQVLSLVTALLFGFALQAWAGIPRSELDLADNTWATSCCLGQAWLGDTMENGIVDSTPACTRFNNEVFKEMCAKIRATPSPSPTEAARFRWRRNTTMDSGFSWTGDYYRYGLGSLALLLTPLVCSIALHMSLATSKTRKSRAALIAWFDHLGIVLFLMILTTLAGCIFFLQFIVLVVAVRFPDDFTYSALPQIWVHINCTMAVCVLSVLVVLLFHFRVVQISRTSPADKSGRRHMRAASTRFLGGGHSNTSNEEEGKDDGGEERLDQRTIDERQEASPPGSTAIVPVVGDGTGSGSETALDNPLSKSTSPR